MNRLNLFNFNIFNRAFPNWKRSVPNQPLAQTDTTSVYTLNTATLHETYYKKGNEMKLINLTGVALVATILSACGGPDLESGVTLEREGDVEGSSFGCYDAPGWDVCSYNAEDIFDNMHVDTEDRGFEGPSHDGIRRRGTWQGNPMTCTEFINIDNDTVDGYSCGLTIAREVEALNVYIDMWNHPNVEVQQSTARRESRDYFSGELTGNTFMIAPLVVGDYRCDGAIHFHGHSNSIDLEATNVHCRVSIQ